MPNGDFELFYGDTGTFSYWAPMRGAWGKNVFTETEIVHGGKYSAKTVNTGDPLILKANDIGDLKPGYTYRFGAWCLNEEGGSVSLKVDIYHGKDPETGGSYCLEKRLAFPANKEWQQQTYEVTIPEETQIVHVMLCNYSPDKTVYFDDVTLEQITEDTEEEILPPRPAEVTLPPLPGTGEMLKNTGFEEGQAHWATASGAKWDVNTFITEEWVHGGKNAVFCKEPGGYLLRQELRDIKEGYQYQASMWVDFSSMTSSAAIRIECYSDYVMQDDTYIAGMGCDPYKPDGLGWKQLVWNFVAPKGTKMIMLYLKTGGDWAYIDDASFMAVKEPAKISLDTEWVFYYTENTYGNASSKTSLNYYPEFKDASVKFEIVEKASGKVVDEQIVKTDAEGNANYKFKTKALEKKQEEYLLNAHLLNADGSIAETRTQRIFRYDRPKYINEDGMYDDGSGPIDIMTMTTLPDTSKYPRATAMGATVAVVYEDATIERLDWLQENGMRAAITLYGGMLPAGHPAKIENTKKVVAALKDHPAVLCWNIMDEGFYNFEDPRDWYIDSYKTVRDIDPNHPVVAVEIQGSSYREASKYMDMMINDIYPASAPDHFKFFKDTMEQGKAATLYQRPLQIYTQAFNYFNYTPTSDEMRNYNFLAFFMGAMAGGYYCFENSVNGLPLDETQMAPGIKEWYEKDQADTIAHFVRGEYPLFNEYRGEDYWYRTYEKDGKLRTIILNSYTDKEVEATVDLTNLDGSIKIGEFTAKVHSGDTEATVSGSEKLTVKIGPGKAVVYEITPKEAVDFSKLPHAFFQDLYEYPWARTQIENLREKEIVNRLALYAYGPAENISRGDFAMFLVRTLGISGEGENFADVDPDAEYAADLAKGKAAGMINGVGENKFNPEGKISRQDMMTMLGRALSLSGEGMEIENTFTDANLVADYALSHVKAVVGNGIIKGNADGTLNPLGNTTRAEAAVIMDRIMNK